MAKKPVKAGIIEKKTFDLKAFKESKGLTRTNKPKDLSWVPLSEAFQEALGIPGIPRGYTTLARGYSNTGKSTAMYEAIVGANKIGDFPIIFDTEGNFNWEHAKNVGVQYEEITDENGNSDYEGDFLYISNRKLLDMYKFWEYDEAKTKDKAVRNEPVIEDIARFIDEVLDMQEAGDFPRNILFIWDSIGSLDCFKAVKSKSKNNMWNAGALETAFKSILNFRISDSQRSDCKYTNSFFAVQKIWFDNINTVIKHKGGEAFFYGARLIIHFGGILTHGTTKLNAEITAGGVTMKYQFGVEAKIKCEKNQVNGIELMGKIASTSHGYWNPDNLTDYKKINKDFILKQLQSDHGEINITKSAETAMSIEDLMA
jgi:hypothetical protein